MVRTWQYCVRAFVLAGLAVPVLAQAQNFIEAPNPQPTAAPVFHRGVYIAEVSALAASVALDGWTTVKVSEEGYMEGASPWLYGRHPTALSYTLPAVAIAGAESFAAYHLEHSRHRWLRWLGHSLITQDIVEHTTGAVQNLALPRTCPTAQEIFVAWPISSGSFGEGYFCPGASLPPGATLQTPPQK